jgi:peptidoglycan hydrolase-like protein with peptidoglycan-binding domain
MEIKVSLPVVNPGAFGDSVSRIQHILNDLDRFTGVQTLLNEDGEYGNKTRERIRRFQDDNGISPSTGGVGERTWRALLEAWLPPVDSR